MLGHMDQQITLQQRVETADGVGGVVRSWENLATDPVVWAHVGAKAGRETVIDGRVDATFVVIFTIWNRPDLTTTHRILWGDRVFNIRGIQRASERELRLRIEAEEGVAE